MDDSPEVIPPAAAPEKALKLLLLASVFAIATCGLIYELIASTLASYLLGDSVLQFSTVMACICLPWASGHGFRNLSAGI